MARKLPALTSADRMLAAEACNLKAAHLEQEACRESRAAEPMRPGAPRLAPTARSRRSCGASRELLPCGNCQYDTTDHPSGLCSRCRPGPAPSTKPPEIPNARTALLPTSRERELAATISSRSDYRAKVASLLARYRVELIGLDGKTDPRLVQVREALHEIQETTNAALSLLEKTP